MSWAELTAVVQIASARDWSMHSTAKRQQLNKKINKKNKNGKLATHKAF